MRNKRVFKRIGYLSLGIALLLGGTHAFAAGTAAQSPDLSGATSQLQPSVFTQGTQQTAQGVVNANSFSPSVSNLTGTAAPVQPTANTAPAKPSDGFISMTGFPAFAQSADANGMSAFLNSLYQYLIGIAIVLAVVEIIMGGFEFMGSGASVTSKEKGKNRIYMALTGLLLVLSPVIIFNLINPKILSLQIGTELTPPPLKELPKSKTPQQVCESVKSSVAANSITYYADANSCGKKSGEICAPMQGSGACGVQIDMADRQDLGLGNITSIFFAQYALFNAQKQCWTDTAEVFISQKSCQDYLDRSVVGSIELSPGTTLDSKYRLLTSQSCLGTLSLPDYTLTYCQ